MMKEIILDLETTGLEISDGHRIVEIGALEMINKILSGRKFHVYLNPERDMPMEAYNIHGISTDFLRDKPLFKNIVKDFLNFIDSGILVIHNAPFDLKFLNYELGRLGMLPLSCKCVDTLFLSKKYFPGARVNLNALCKKFGVDCSFRNYHGALKDAVLLAQVYVKLCKSKQNACLFSSTIDITTSSIVNNSIDYNCLVLKDNAVVFSSDEDNNLHQEYIDKNMINL